MARPPQANAERTKQRLLAAASELFSRRGVSGTSLREVARAAGVTMATIHYHFGSKDALYAACLDTAYSELAIRLEPLGGMLQGLVEELRLAASSQVELAAVIERVVRASFRFARQRRPALQLLQRTLVETGELDARWREGSFLPFLEQAAQVLAPALGQPEGQLRWHIQSLAALGMRYALSTPRELARFDGQPEPAGKRAAEAAVRAAEDHLVRVAQRLLQGV